MRTRAGILVCAAFLFAASTLTSSVSAQTTRPGAFDDQAIRRAAAAQPKDLQTAAPTPSRNLLDAKQVGMALLVVVGLAFALRWAATRFMGIKGSSRQSDTVRLISRTPISPRQQVLLLQVGRRLIVAADSGGQISSLTQITDPDEVAELIGKATSKVRENPGVFGAIVGKAHEAFEGADEVLNDDDEQPAPAPAVEVTRAEISGLMEKVRAMSQQFKK